MRALRLLTHTLGWVALTVAGFSLAAGLVSNAFVDPSVVSILFAITGSCMIGFMIVLAWMYLRNNFLPRRSFWDASDLTAEVACAQTSGSPVAPTQAARWWTDTASREEIRQINRR